MRAPIEVSKSANAAFDGERWNAFIDFISRSNLDELTRIQRVAHLAWWYSSEVLNGGHDQYFGNKESFDHLEVISALDDLNAKCQRNVLQDPWAYYENIKKEIPDGYDEYIAWEKEVGYSKQMIEFDERFYICQPEIETELLEAYLNKHEAEFIKWID